MERPGPPGKEEENEEAEERPLRPSDQGIMRFATTVMSLSTLLYVSNIGSIKIARAETIVPGARSLTIDESLRLIDTETSKEFGYVEG